MPTKRLAAVWVNKAKKFTPNGKREITRRQRQIEAGQLPFWKPTSNLLYLRDKADPRWLLPLLDDPLNVQTMRKTQCPKQVKRFEPSGWTAIQVITKLPNT